MKEKQIEEIAKDLKENLRLCAGVKLLDHQVETIAYELSKKYQPKLSKDSVVLSGLDLADYKHYKEYTKSLAMVEKETAVSLLSELYYIARFYYGNNANILAWAKDKAKRLGVEIKE